jgi:hypothetical protein
MTFSEVFVACLLTALLLIPILVCLVFWLGDWLADLRPAVRANMAARTNMAQHNFHSFTPRPHADMTIAELEAAIRQVEAKLAELRPQAKAALQELGQAEKMLSGPAWNSFIGRTPAEADLHLLGLSKGATREDLQKAYRQRVKEAHPDKFGPPGLMSRLALAKERLEECLPTEAEKEAAKREEERKKVPPAVREEALRAAMRKAQNLASEVRRREDELRDLNLALQDHRRVSLIELAD